MRIASLMAGAVLALGMATASAPADAAPRLPNMSYSDAYLNSQIEPAGHWRGHHRRWGYCRAWRHECADRWGWGTWRYRRCLWRHGC